MKKNCISKKHILLSLFLLFLLQPAYSQWIYKGGYSAVTGTWDERGLLLQVTGQAAYEGGQHYQFTYDITDYWAGFGLNLNYWNQFPGVDLSNSTHLRVAYRGLEADQNLRVTLRSGDTIFGQEVELGVLQTDYQTVDIPLTAMKGASNLNLANVSELMFSVIANSGTGTGTVYIDAIEAVTLAPPPPSVAWPKWERFGIGMNLNNWLEAYWLIPYDAYPDIPRFTFDDIKFFHDAGVRSLRLPVTAERLALPTPPYSVDFSNTAFALIDSTIAWADRLGMNVIIDNHHGDPGLTNANYQSQIPRITAVWRQLVQRYGHLDPQRYFFELYNEPTSEISNTNFRRVAQAIMDTIRPLVPQHTIIIGAVSWNSGAALTAIEPYSDSNIIYTFHNYDPYYFTHQGFSWSGLPGGVPFPQGNQVGELKNLFAGIQAWSEYWDVPVMLGEYGASTYADPSDRCKWISEFGELISQYDLPHFYWDMKTWGDSFGFFRNNVLHPDSALSCFTDALHLEWNAPVSAHEPVAKVESAEWKLYPNPASGSAAVQLFLNTEGPVRLRLFDGAGRLERVWNYELPSGNQTMVVPLVKIQPGNYWIELTSNGKINAQMLVVR